MILCTGIKVYIQPRSLHQQEKNHYSKSLFLKKILPKGHYSEICNFILTYDFFGVKTVGNTNNEPSEYQPTCMPSAGELSMLLDFYLFC